MRNNEDRLGSKAVQANSTAATQAATGPAPLEFVRPTTIVTLPSEGKFYSENHPLYNQDTIEIRQMTTAEEDILTSKTLLQKGVALDKFLERILIDSRVGPDDLLIGDKNAVMIQARIDGYGSDYTTQVSCPACEARQKFTFNLEESLSATATTTTDEITQNEQGNFLVTLDNDWVVEFRALTGADEKKIAKSMANKKKAGLPESPIQDQLNAIIVSVSGHSDRGTISKAVQHMTGKQSRTVREAYAKSIPNVELRSEFSCGSCGTATEMEVPLTADFFWART